MADDKLDTNGLTIKTLSDLKTELTADLKTIYGDDINVDSDTPDGQIIGILCQAGRDLREILSSVCSSFDPEQASGTLLDERVNINGITRKGATFTITPVNITVDRTVNLVGLDDASEAIDFSSDVYQVKDDAGTKFALLSSVTITAGTHSLEFRAVNIGNVAVTINTITTPVTAVAGVTAISNTASLTQQGEDEETDAALRIRRERSVSLTSQGYTDAIEAAIKDLDDVTACIVNENDTDSTDSDGVPAHSIWVIVEGGDDDEIAQAIYSKRPAGIGMKGDEEIYVTRANGTTAVMKFDRSVTVDLYVHMSVSLAGSGSVDTDYIKEQLVSRISYAIGDNASSDSFVCLIKDLSAKYTITGCEISIDNTNWYETITCPTPQSRFVLDVSRITIS